MTSMSSQHISIQSLTQCLGNRLPRCNCYCLPCRHNDTRGPRTVSAGTAMQVHTNDYQLPSRSSGQSYLCDPIGSHSPSAITPPPLPSLLLPSPPFSSPPLQPVLPAALSVGDRIVSRAEEGGGEEAGGQDCGPAGAQARAQEDPGEGRRAVAAAASLLFVPSRQCFSLNVSPVCMHRFAFCPGVCSTSAPSLALTVSSCLTMVVFVSPPLIPPCRYPRFWTAWFLSTGWWRRTPCFCSPATK